MSAPRVPFLTTPLAVEPDEPEDDILTEDDKVEIFDHVAEFVDWITGRFPVCPSCLPELVANYVEDVVGPELALTDHQNAPTSMAVH